MRLTQLKWNTTRASIQVRGNGNQNLLDIRTEKPSVSQQSKNAKVKIDQTECWSELGMKGIGDFMNDQVSFARTMLAQGIDRTVDQGNQMMDFHKGGGAFAELADHNAFETTMNYGAGPANLPAPRPRISVDPATLNYSFTPGRAVVSARFSKAEISYSPGKIEFYTE